MYDPNDYPDNGEGGSDLLPVGKHIVTVFDHEVSRTSGGYRQIVANFRASNGKTRKGWLIFEGKAGFQLGQLLRAVDWHEKLDVDSDLAIRRAIYNKPLQIVVEEDTYNGETKPKIKYYNKAPAGTKMEPSGNQRDPGRDEAPPPDDEAIPF